MKKVLLVFIFLISACKEKNCNSEINSSSLEFYDQQSLTDELIGGKDELGHLKSIEAVFEEQKKLYPNQRLKEGYAKIVKHEDNISSFIATFPSEDSQFYKVINQYVIGCSNPYVLSEYKYQLSQNFPKDIIENTKHIGGCKQISTPNRFKITRFEAYYPSIVSPHDGISSTVNIARARVILKFVTDEKGLLSDMVYLDDVDNISENISVSFYYLDRSDIEPL